MKGRPRYKCKACGLRTTRMAGMETEQAKGIDRKSADKLHSKMRAAEGIKRYVITSAQNATPIDKLFFASLLTYCKHRHAQLIVIPYRYKNPTSVWSQKAQHDDWWAPEVARYILDRRINLNKHLSLLADIKTQPTATSPLSGFETMAGSRSAIIGHPKIELVSVPTPQAKLPKLLVTTGSLTKKNYLPSKAGKKAEFHHSFGACVAEINGDQFHIRQINACRDGSFMDLDAEYRGSEVETGIPLAALVMGDSHIEVISPPVVKATFCGPKSIVGFLKPKELVWHDLHDFYSRNHHHRGEVFINLVKHRTGRDNIERWLDDTFAFVDKHTPPGTRNVLVPSNHPDALLRWLKETDPRTDPENCVLWAQLFEALAKSAKWTATGARTADPFIYLAKQKLKCAARTVFLERGDSYLICGIECGFHGDVGSNGGPGSITGYAKIGVKTVTGHGHSPGIKDGAYRVGTSTPPLEYCRGAPSSWLNTHCGIYRNGKRSLYNIIGEDWRA